jgi:hypothetical protein
LAALTSGGGYWPDVALHRAVAIFDDPQALFEAWRADLGMIARRAHA